MKILERERLVVDEAEAEAGDSSDGTDLDMSGEVEPGVRVTKHLTHPGMTSMNTTVEMRWNDLICFYYLSFISYYLFL